MCEPKKSPYRQLEDRCYKAEDLLRTANADIKRITGEISSLEKKIQSMERESIAVRAGYMGYQECVEKIIRPIITR